MSANRSPLRIIAAALIVAAGVCLVAWIYAIGLTDQSVTERDYIEYWAAERLLLNGSNPYGIPETLQIQKSAGMVTSEARITPSPPIAFILALPLGMLSAKTGLVAWLLVSMACTLLSILLIWQEYGKPENRYHLIGICFPPVLSCMMAGQLGIFFLLGYSLFLRFHQKHPWLAGAALFPCALKPHLFLPCAVVLLLWSVRRKDLRVPAGFLLTLAASSALTLFIDLQVWHQYRELMQKARILDVFIPTVSVALRFAIAPSTHWIEFVPVTVACVWAIHYYWTRRESWAWRSHGMLLLMVSLCFAPYAWFSDEAVLLPAVLAAIYSAGKNPRVWQLLALVWAGDLIGVIGAIQLPSPFYVWTAPAWLAWYLYATQGSHHAVPNAALAAE